MTESEMLKTILSNLSDIIVVEDSNGNIHYQNHPEINFSTFKKESKVDDEFYDEEKKRWYKLSETKFNLENSRFALKKYAHITKIKKQQSILEKDGKTGLLRSEVFEEKIKYLSKLDKKMILVLIDIDYFKKVNDFYGHESGNDVLSKIGLLIKSIFRGSDLLGRFGGDELVLSLVDIDIEMAVQKLEILRQAVTNIVLTNDHSSHYITISAGCILYDNNLNYKENINRVDQILYTSKENGRNMISSSKDVKVQKLK